MESREGEYDTKVREIGKLSAAFCMRIIEGVVAG